MTEGSPGIFCKSFRFSKRSRTSDGRDDESENVTEPILSSTINTDMNPALNHEPTSFRDTLMSKINLVRNVGIDVTGLEDKHEDLNDEEDVTIAREERGPCIQFSDRAMSRLCKPWQNALIIKLLGRSHTYNYLQARLQQKWSLKGGWNLIDLVNDYFVVKFDLEEDLNFVLTGGPWIIAGQYLVMQKWRSGFCPATAQISRMAAWIRVSAMQLECFDIWALKRIGNLLGKLLKIDTLTTSQNRGKFARICVELDLTQPLDAFVKINQVWYNIEYEGLPDICYLCGRYGHKRENCPLKTIVADQTGVAQSTSTVEPMGTDTATEKEIIDGSEENVRGPWMNVPTRRKTKFAGKDLGGKSGSPQTHGSRFDALKNLDDLVDNAEDTEGVLTGKNHLVSAGSSGFNAGVGKKVWTKSKANANGHRQALNDISNNSNHVIANRNAVTQKEANPLKTTYVALATRNKAVIGGKRTAKIVSVNEQLSNWVCGQNSYNETGTYIFGHQPPNIIDTDLQPGEEPGTELTSVALGAASTLGEASNEKMDIVEGQTSDSDMYIDSNASNTARGMIVDC